MSFATTYERYFVSLVNSTRKDLGLQPLQIAKSLNDSADGHTSWMLAQDVFSHTGRGGTSASARIEAAGYPMYGQSWSTRENIAYIGVSGASDLRDEIRDLHRNLLNSPDHYKNIVDPKLEHIGIGLEMGNFKGHSVVMVTQNYGATTGNPVLDTGRFATIREPIPRIENDLRADWLDDDFNGQVIRSAPGGAAVNGTVRADDFRLGGASDVAYGRAGDDWMVGGGGHDTLDGGPGNDRLFGGNGFDVLRGGGGSDYLYGEAGNDRLDGGDGHDLLRGGAGRDVLIGGAGQDTLLGDADADSLDGGVGNDWLVGGAGNDTLIGGAGNDTLIGGTGADIMRGGTGADSFVFHRGHGADRIADYQSGVDRLLIDDALIGNNVARFYDNFIRETANGVIIDFGRGDKITIIGNGLTAESIADDILIF